jgi:hypothetical protein
MVPRDGVTMRVLRHFSRLTFAFWLGLLALMASGVEQYQLSTNVIQTAFAEARAGVTGVSGHFMPDGTFMAGPMSHDMAREAGGHTHKGHMDCEVCGALAALAAFTLPSLIVLAPPIGFALPERAAVLRAPVLADISSPYSSRAPPVMG